MSERVVESAGRRSIASVVAVIVVPLLVLAAVTVVVARNGDHIISGFGHNPPAADELVIERTHFRPGTIEIDVANPQSTRITPALVTVDGAIAAGMRVRGGGASIEPRGTRTLVVPYDWIADDPYAIGITSSTGITTEMSVPAAVPDARPRARGLAWGALVGGLVGLLPVALGLAWLPALRRLSARVLAGFLGFTAGLLTFLAVDAAAEALDSQARLIPSLGGAGMVAMGVLVSMVALGLVGHGLRRGAHLVVGRSTGSEEPDLSAAALAVLIAIGIGMHNLGEGLAIGSSVATGEASLAISLVIGFMVHNLTEGIGIASPIARGGEALGLVRGAGLALVAGLPAIAGIWLGRYVGGTLFATLCFAIAAGAALQVVVEVGRVLRRDPGGLAAPRVQLGFALGLLAMWLTGSIVG